MEREYVVPLRRESLKSPRYKRTNKAVKALRAFISKHMKSENVLIGKFLNLKLWENGIRNPPGKVTVRAVKDDDGTVTVELKEIPQVRPKVNKRLARVEKSEGKKVEKPAKVEKPKTEKKTETPAKVEKPKTEKKAEIPVKKTEAPKKELESKPSAKKDKPKKESKE